MENFVVKFEVPVDEIRSLLVGAFEGGSNYWADIKDYKFPEGTTKDDFKTGKYAVKDRDHNWHVAYVLPFVENGGLIIEDCEDDKEYVLDLTKIQTGLQAMAIKAPRHFADFISENHDADTSDVFLQCCLFGEIVYG
jgi:hypothetical protein